MKRREAEWPANSPMSANSSSMAVMRPPRLAGDKKPSTANTSVTTIMPSSCTPVPT